MLFRSITGGTDALCWISMRTNTLILKTFCAELLTVAIDVLNIGTDIITANTDALCWITMRINTLML